MPDPDTATLIERFTRSHRGTLVDRLAVCARQLDGVDIPEIAALIREARAEIELLRRMLHEDANNG